MANVYMRIQTEEDDSETGDINESCYLRGGSADYQASSLGTVTSQQTDSGTATRVSTISLWSQVREVTIDADQEISGTPSTGGPQAYGRVDLPDVVITKDIDPMTPRLFELCCKGKNIPEIVLHFLDTGHNGALMYSIVLTNSVFTSQQTRVARATKRVQRGGTAYPDEVTQFYKYESHSLIERITINYTTIRHTCHDYYYGDRKSDINITRGWDIGENAAIDETLPTF